MLTLLPFLFSSLIFSQYHPQEWGSITSILTPTGIRSSADGVMYISTSGGLLEFSPNTETFITIKMDEGLVYLDLSCIEIDSQGRLWLGGAYPNGYLQVYDLDRGLIRKITHLDIAEIKIIRIGENIAFVVYEGSTSSDIGILEFLLDDDGLPTYKDYLNNFSNESSITEIRDLDLFQDSLIYVTTDKGIFVGNYIEDNLKFADHWAQQFFGDSAIQFVPANNPFVITKSSILQKQGSNWPNYYVGLTGEIIDADKSGGVIEVLTDKWYYEIDNSMLIYDFEIPDISHSQSIFTSYRKFDNNHLYFGLQNAGLLSLNKEADNYRIFIPNTPFINKYQALTVTSKGYLAATSNYGTLVWNGNTYHNYIPWQYTVNIPTNQIDPEGIDFAWTYMQYTPGEHDPITIIEKSDGNLFFCNSGVIPNDTIWLSTPAAIGLDIITKEFAGFDTTNGVIDGMWNIYNDGLFSAYMVVNQIENDKLGNLWITNPYCEKNGHLLTIQMADNGTWSNVGIPDSNSYRPQTIAFDKMNRAWIGFAYESDYSSGGIKVFRYSNIETDYWIDSSWMSIDNPETLPGNDPYTSIWSLVFDQMDFLWVLNEQGVRGFTYSVNDNTMKLDPILKAIDGTAIDFLSYISYTKGNRIRVDSQNNKWVITHQGVWVIQESMAFWPSEKGLNMGNSGLLSDIVYDVAFDDDKGLAYLATDKGISILQIPFADNPSKKQSMYISPNPFIMPDNEKVIIKNVPSGAIIQIMTITGTLIKEIQLPSNESQTEWDGTNEQGEQVGTAVYLVAAHHSSERNKVSKIAVIRK